MGAIEDVRQVIQDLVAPELKSLDVRLTSMEGIAAARHEALLAQLARLEYKVDSNQEAVSQKLDLNRRMERIELAQSEESARRSGGSSSRHRSRSAGRPVSTDRP